MRWFNFMSVGQLKIEQCIIDLILNKIGGCKKFCVIPNL